MIHIMYFAIVEIDNRLTFTENRIMTTEVKLTDQYIIYLIIFIQIYCNILYNCCYSLYYYYYHNHLNLYMKLTFSLQNIVIACSVFILKMWNCAMNRKESTAIECLEVKVEDFFGMLERSLNIFHYKMLQRLTVQQ